MSSEFTKPPQSSLDDLEPQAQEKPVNNGLGLKPRVGRGSTIDQLMPVVLFLGFYNFVNIETAVIAATLWSLKAAISRRRKGLNIGLILPVVTGYLIVRSGVTIAVERDIIDFGISTEGVYFGISFATKILAGVALAVTIWLKRPFLGWLVVRFIQLPAGMAEDPRFKRTMSVATWFVVSYEILSGVWDILLYNSIGVNLFVVARFGVNYVVSVVAIFGGLYYIDRKLSPIEGYDGLVSILQQSVFAKQDSDSKNS